MEKHEWYCPICYTYHRIHITEWKSEKCKFCFTEVLVSSRGDVIRAVDRYNDYGLGVGMGYNMVKVF